MSETLQLDLVKNLQRLKAQIKLSFDSHDMLRYANEVIKISCPIPAHESLNKQILCTSVQKEVVLSIVRCHIADLIKGITDLNHIRTNLIMSVALLSSKFVEYGSNSHQELLLDLTIQMN